MPSKPRFSIILPTYSGVETINKTFASILEQKELSESELIIIIDGPNQRLAQICAAAKQGFQKRFSSVTIRQFTKNKGRFAARLEGARLANSDQLLFVDDRITFDKNYLTNLFKFRVASAMPNVKEIDQKTTPISLTLKLIRKKLYRGKWGDNFADHYVDRTNFEKLPKGTAALWIPKNVFLSACREVAKRQRGSEKYTHDDTRILREAVQAGTKILRSSKLTIFYHPRTSFRQEVRHLFDRGVRFVDYYSKSGTRLFPVFVGYYLVLIGLAFTAVFWPALLAVVLGVLVVLLLATALFLAGLSSRLPLVFVGLALITVVFGSGVLKGTYLRLARNG